MAFPHLEKVLDNECIYTAEILAGLRKLRRCKNSKTTRISLHLSKFCYDIEGCRVANINADTEKSKVKDTNLR